MEHGRLYQREGSDYWYIDFKDPVTGKRERFSTKTVILNEAREILRKLEYSAAGRTSDCTFGQALSQYRDPKTNPRKKEALTEGRSYGTRYTKKVAWMAGWIFNFLSEEYPSILDKRLADIKRADIRRIRDMIIREKGLSRNAQEKMRFIKAIFSNALSLDLIETNPCLGIHDIRYDEQQREAVPEDALAKVIASRSLFFDQECWAFFTILSTTGMRRSECMALNIEQIDGKDLKIDRAFKDDDMNEIGLPKWNFVRNIRLADIALTAMKVLKPDRDGRLLNRSKHWINKQIEQWKVVGKLVAPEVDWQKVTPHALRHSLNTNLIVNGCNPVIVSEYLSWEHQSITAIQKRYTHIYASNTAEIARKIDELYVVENEDKPLTLLK